MAKFTSPTALLICFLAMKTTAEQSFPSGEPRDATYDYVVIGGGTAGLAIASRLSVSASVAVIEAGGIYEKDTGNQSVVPFYAMTLPFIDSTEGYPHEPLVDWDLLTTPQSGLLNRRLHYAQGKTLGGCSAINTLAYHRGTKGSYQRWADHVEDDSYTMDNLLPYFKRTATLTPPNEKKRDAPNASVLYDPSVFDNSLQGPLQVSWGNWVDPPQSWFARALQAIGMDLSPTGFSAGVVNGGGWVTSTIDPKDATRSSSKTSYLEEIFAQSSSASKVYIRSQASKILFDVEKKASGVLVSAGNQTFTLSARKEVILSAGVFHSPQILMLSGIGPAATLSAHSIETVSDLPGVGQNLQDQVFFNVFRGISVKGTASYLLSPEQQATADEEWRTNAAGPLSATVGYLSFEKLPSHLRGELSDRTIAKLAEFPSDWPEIEYLPTGFPYGDLPYTFGGISATLLTPSSRGTVTINSTSVQDQPVIDLGWLRDPADGETLVAAFKRLREAWNSPAIAEIVVSPELVPGDTVSSDEDILNFIRGAAQPIWHASSTCAMGKSAEDGAVVDAKAKVFGVKGLRVVDASIIPFCLPGHPQSSVYMLAEKIAEDILERKWR